MPNRIVIGTRGSQLALWQADRVAGLIREILAGTEVELKKIKTTGDKILDSPLAKIGDKGLFVREIENALLERGVDLAVHSMKDLPTDLPEGLMIGAYLKRDNPADALITSDGGLLDDLRPGAVIGTSSLRRKAQLLAHRPDLKFVDLRGNIDTRLRKLTEQGLDAILLSGAGLTRLGWEDKITERLSSDIVVPAVGQGVVAVEIRRDDAEMKGLAGLLNDNDTRSCVVAERMFSLRIGGGCQVPMGALAHLENGKLILEAAVASLDGATLMRDRIEGDPADAEELGIALAEAMLTAGADSILDEIRLCEAGDK